MSTGATADAGVDPGVHAGGLRRGHEPAHLRRVFGAFPSGVVAVAAQVDDVPVGLVVSSFTSVSLDPALVSVCIARGTHTWSRLRLAPRIGLSILAASQERHGRQLAARGIDRFADLQWRVTADGAVLIDGASAWLEVSVEREVPVGDHDIVVLDVHELRADPEVRPLIFHASRFVGLAAGVAAMPSADAGRESGG